MRDTMTISQPTRVNPNIHFTVLEIAVICDMTLVLGNYTESGISWGIWYRTRQACDNCKTLLLLLLHNDVLDASSQII